MRRSSQREKDRRTRRSTLFTAGMCLHECGRPARPGQNICQRCDDELCLAYFGRLAARGDANAAAKVRAIKERMR